MGSIENRVLACLDEQEGSDLFDIRMQTGLSLAQISAALQRLRKRGLAATGRWHETSVWWKADAQVRA